MKTKIKKVRIVGLMLVFTMLFSGMGVFAEEPEVVGNEDMPVAVATLTDEFGNVQELDVECTVERIVSKGRNSDYPMYRASYRTESNSGDKTSSGASAQLDIYYQVDEDTGTMYNSFRITSVIGSWNPNGKTILNREVYVRNSVYEHIRETPNSNSYSYATGFFYFMGKSHTYATATAAIGGKSLELKVSPK